MAKENENGRAFPIKTERKRKSEKRKSRHFPSVDLKIESGSEVELSRPEEHNLVFLARNYARVYDAISGLAKTQEETSDEIKDIAREHEGLMGVVEPGVYDISIFPSEAVSYSRQGLREGLGTYYEEVVRDEVLLTFTVPRGFDPQLARDALGRLLCAKGRIPKSEIERYLQMKINSYVDEIKLEELLKRGAVTLADGTKKVETAWTVRPNKVPPKEAD